MTVEGPLTAADFRPVEAWPPEGTAYGTVCWLEHRDGKKAAGEWSKYTNPLSRPVWRFPGALCSPAEVARLGWRFHSIAVVPE